MRDVILFVLCAGYVGLLIPLLWLGRKVTELDVLDEARWKQFRDLYDTVKRLSKAFDSHKAEDAAAGPAAAAAGVADTLRTVAAVLNREADEYDPPKA